ncbi:MAG TPA: ATP-grasp domain-containing protein [Rhizomicrobium sp.]|nr:ATP-grasp domain-containing protein [Rhizomicrobium sp.]
MRVLVLHSDIAADAPPEEQDTLIAADAVAAALIRKGHKAVQAAFRKDPAAMAALLEENAPDLVFNLVEGVDGLGQLAPQAPALLARLDMAFTGVTAEAMALTNDKPRTKRHLREAGLATPDWSVPPDWAGVNGGRYIVKSVLEDASIGLDDGCVVSGTEAIRARAAHCTARYGGDWFAEKFVEGREFNIAVVEERGVPRILPMAEMRFESWPDGKPRIVGYAAKWQEDSAGWNGTVRAFGVERNESALAAKLSDACRRTWALFGLSGFVRVDFRVTEGGEPLILEINANPCISPDAGFAAAAAEAGICYDDLIAAIVDAAAK